MVLAGQEAPCQEEGSCSKEGGQLLGVGQPGCQGGQGTSRQEDQGQGQEELQPGTVVLGRMVGHEGKLCGGSRPELPGQILTWPK